MATPKEILFVRGGINVRGVGGFGHLLITKNFVFALREDLEAAGKRGLLFGLLGYFVGAWLDAKKAEKNPPAYFKNPDIAELDPKFRKQLLILKLAAAIPVAAGLRIETNGSKFIFQAEGYAPITYGEVLHTKKVRKYLQERSMI